MTLRKNQSYDPAYLLLGCIDNKTSKESGLKSGEIKISDNYLKHIKNDHWKELEYFGFKAEDFVRFIVENFNQIREGTGNSYLLVVYDKKYPKVAAIELNYSLKKEFWEIKTAEPRRIESVEKRKLLYEKKNNGRK